MNCLPDEIKISSVTFDSRKVIPGSLFTALRGVSSDGHAFVEQAFQSGAAAAVVEDGAVLGGRPGLIVGDSRRAVSRLAATWTGELSKRFRTIGVTGTNGKTTTVWLLFHALNHLGQQAFRVGTLGAAVEGAFDLEGSLTTPDPFSLHALFARAKAAGATDCAMEASSHALDQLRVEEIGFDVGVFTNLTHDHLDYHKTMEHYFQSKLHLFELLLAKPEGLRRAVVNLDDPYGVQLLTRLPAGLQTYTFGFAEGADFQIKEFKQALHGSRFRIFTRTGAFEIETAFVGRYNAQNLTAAFAALSSCGYERAELARVFKALPQVPGRLESCGNEKIGLFVDYAHTPDALQNALGCLRDLAKGQLWVVFGCGGDRDRTKRPEMGKIARKLADRVVVTSDNPRTEEPGTIIAEILAGQAVADIVEVDREKAIRRAVFEAAPGDVILIAGKGHENYQIIGSAKRHFSDVEIARAALESRGI